MLKQHSIPLAVVIILAVVSAVYLPSLRNGFTNWDDGMFVTESNIITSLSADNIREISTRPHAMNYHPLALLSYALEYHFVKLNPLIYHLTNLILHLLNCLLVFWLLFIFSRNMVVALIAALLFGVHPLHVESVAWISERRDVLYAFFFLSSLISYLYYVKKSSKKFFWLSLAFFILSLLSKAMAMVLPLCLLLFDYALGIKIGRKNFLEKIPFFAAAFLFTALTIIIRIIGKDFYAGGLFNLGYGLKIACFNIIFFLAKALAPFKLSCLYPYDYHKQYLYRDLLWIYPIPVVILAIPVILSARYTKKIIFGVSLFLVSLLPFAQAVYSKEAVTLVYDRYFYISSIGLFYLVGEFFFWLNRKLSAFSTALKIFGWVILTAAVFSLSVLSWQRCKVWTDSITLWSDVLNNYPSVASAYINRAAAYLEKKDYPKAYVDLNAALALEPDVYEAYCNLGSLYNSLGEYEKAIGQCRRAIEINPLYPEAYFNLAEAYYQTGKIDEAAKLLQKAIALAPDYMKPYLKLAEIYGKSGRHLEVIGLCKMAIQRKPDYAQAYDYLCAAYGIMGDYTASLEAGKKALKCNPDLVSGHYNIAAAYSFIQEFTLADKHYKRAVELGFKKD